MKDLVTIDMKTTQTCDGESDVTKNTYHGRCKIEDGVVEILYMSEDASGKVRNTLRFAADKCELTSAGDVSRHMEFIPGKRTSSLMKLPMGSLEMDIVTHGYELDIVEGDTAHMAVMLHYDLYSGGMLAAENKLEMQIKPRG